MFSEPDSMAQSQLSQITRLGQAPRQVYKSRGYRIIVIVGTVQFKVMNFFNKGCRF
jgi:hypothetical protein